MTTTDTTTDPAWAAFEREVNALTARSIATLHRQMDEAKARIEADLAVILTEAEVDDFARRHEAEEAITEGRIHRPHPVNFHDL